jgi:hypothetical protein
MIFSFWMRGFRERPAAAQPASLNLARSRSLAAISKWDRGRHTILVRTRSFCRFDSVSLGRFLESKRIHGEPLLDLIERVVLGRPEEDGRDQAQRRSNHARGDSGRSRGLMRGLGLARPGNSRFGPRLIAAPGAPRRNDEEPGRHRDSESSPRMIRNNASPIGQGLRTAHRSPDLLVHLEPDLRHLALQLAQIGFRTRSYHCH